MWQMWQTMQIQCDQNTPPTTAQQQHQEEKQQQQRKGPTGEKSKHDDFHLHHQQQQQQEHLQSKQRVRRAELPPKRLERAQTRTNRTWPSRTSPSIFNKTITTQKPTTTTTHLRRRLPTSAIFFYATTQMLLLLLITRAQPTAADWLMDCGDCHCKWNSGKKTADCKNLSLAAVPENLSNEVQVLDLSFNRILYLEQNAFLNADLHNLHKLFIRNSSLQQIDPRTFTQLEILIELDLSNNQLRSLQANVFVRLVKVRALVLNGNQLEALADGVFQNLKYLHKVELKHNRLKRIATQTFVNLPLLTQIYLDGNRLNFLRKETFESLKRLTALSLDQNPWNCTCELQIFRDFVLKRNLYTAPTACYYPAHLRGMLWMEDMPEAFACKPKIIYPAPGASINTAKENVTLVCRVHASPNTHIAWDYNKQMYRSNVGVATTSTGVGGGVPPTGGLVSNGQQHGQRVHIQLLRDEQSKEKEIGRDVFVSRLTILGAEKSDEGVYTCLAENAGGKDAVQMSLLVQKTNSKDFLLQGNLLIVICLMALGLLSVSVFLAMVTCCIYKRFKAINPSHHHHHHHHLNNHHLLHNNRQHHQLDDGGVGGPAQGGGGGGGLGGPQLEEHQTTTMMTTSVSGGTDVVLGISVDNTAVGNFKHHLQKQNGGYGGGGGVAVVLGGGLMGKEKYTEVLRHGIAAVMDNGMVTTIGSGGGGGGDGSGSCGRGSPAGGGILGGGHAEKAYLEQRTEDTLHIKYPHGIVRVDIGRGSLGGGGHMDGGKRQSDGSIGGGGVGDSGSLMAAEYQPDLLPAYSKTNNNNNTNSGGGGGGSGSRKQPPPTAAAASPPYSPIKVTKTINPSEDQQQQLISASHAPKSKYNSSALGYLQAKYGSARERERGDGGGGGGGLLKGGSLLPEKSTKKDLSGMPLTMSASLTAAAMSATSGASTTTAALPATGATQESGFGTLQRHSRSLAHRSAAAAAAATPTEAGVGGGAGSSYEYRQPPPPPYSAAHRTANGLLLQQQAPSTRRSDDKENNGYTKDQGYRDTMSHPHRAGSSSPSGATTAVGAPCAVTATRQTIVTASPSLNFLTTTEYTPRRQLL